MSSDTTKSEPASAAESSPSAADLQRSQSFLANWAREINEREQAAGDEQQTGKPASRRRGNEKHFGRHREDPY
jgi:hypothetical protein